MQDAALRLPERARLPEGWREGLRAWAELVRDAYRSHHWVLGIPRGQSSVLMPNSMWAADLGLGGLADLELDMEAKVGTILVVSQLAASMVELEEDLAAEGLLATTAAGSALLGEVITPERCPHIAGLFATNARAGGEESGEDLPVIDGGTLGVDDEFGRGLSLIIDGLERRVARSRV